MQFRQPIPVREIAERIRARIIGDPEFLCTGLNEIHKVGPGDILFVDVAKYFEKALRSAASVIILNEEVEAPPGKVLLVVDNPFEAYDSLTREFKPFFPLDQPREHGPGGHRIVDDKRMEVRRRARTVRRLSPKSTALSSTWGRSGS